MWVEQRRTELLCQLLGPEQASSRYGIGRDEETRGDAVLGEHWQRLAEVIHPCVVERHGEQGAPFVRSRQELIEGHDAPNARKEP